MGGPDSGLAPPSPNLVKVWSASGDFLGTGFFVAARTVVTCAHVVEHADDVRIGWSGPDLTGRVLVRDPQNRAGKRHYPAPDIAFIGVDTLDNPVAFLDANPLSRDLKSLFVEGFSVNNPTGRVALERRWVPLLGEVIGESEGYRLLGDTHIVPGMSGSPVVETDGAENALGMLKSGKLAQGNSAYMIPAWEIKKSFRLHKRLLRAHMRDLPALVRPRPGSSLHMLLTAQREVAKRYPYRVTSLTRRDPPPLSSVYVEQRTRANHPARGKPLVISPVELLHRHRNALIVGGAGGGKSTLIQQLVATSADWGLREPNGKDEPPLGRVVAVRAGAQDLLDGSAWFTSLARAVNNDLGGRLDVMLTPEQFEQPPAPGADWLILVDGLDEVLDRGVRRELVGRYGSTTRFVVASRPLDDREFGRLRASLTTSDRTKRLGEYDLRPFGWDAVQKFAGNWFRPAVGEQSPVEPADFLEAIATAGLAPLVEVPLLATIAAIVFEEKPSLPLPLDRAGLYETFVEVLLTLREQRMGAREALQQQLAPLGRSAEAVGERMFDDRRDCLSHLAVAYLRSGRRLTDSLTAWLRERYSRLPLGVTAEHMRALLVDTGLVAVYGDDLVFIHQSFAEYLASLLLVGEFDPDVWLKQVRRTGPDSLGLFTLAAWGDAGHDTRPVVEALMAPGEQKQYPHLRQAAAMIQDGGVFAAGGTEEIIELAEEAVRQVADIPEHRVLQPPQRETRKPDRVAPAVGEVLRAILQRTRDATRVVRLVDDAALSIGKRTEAARTLITSEIATEREIGRTELVRLAYDMDLNDEERLWALFVIVETAPPHERRHALQRLTQYVETVPDLGIRMIAMNLLRNAGQAPAAMAALLRRALDTDRPAEERTSTLQVLLFYLSEDRVDQPPHAGHEPGDEFEESTWRTPVLRPEPVGWERLGILQLVNGTGGIPAVALDRYIRARHVDWADRAFAVTWPLGGVAIPHSPGPQSPTEPGTWQAVRQLAADREEHHQRRIALLLDYARRMPPRTGDVTALLTDWLRNPRVPRRERKAALSALLNEVPDTALPLARDPELPIRFRAVAAFGHGLRTGRRSEAYRLLSELASDPGATPWVRLGCLARRAFLSMLIRREETG
jgi:hypothetical protein